MSLFDPPSSSIHDSASATHDALNILVGVHSNIGGGYGRDGLANIALRWILSGAKDQYLDLDWDFLDHFEGHSNGALYNSVNSRLSSARRITPARRAIA